MPNRLGDLTTKALWKLEEKIRVASLGQDPQTQREFRYFRSQVMEELNGRVQ